MPKLLPKKRAKKTSADGLQMPDVHKMPKAVCDQFYKLVMEQNDTEIQRWLCQHDLYFLLTVGFNRKDIRNETPLKNTVWLYERIREVEADPNYHIDLWAREHYKSTIITYGMTIMNILEDPNITVGIFSHSRKMAVKFLQQIKSEFETNEYLKGLFPDVLYDKPITQSPRWSLEKGIQVKRSSNDKEATVEAHGVVDSQPIGSHFKLMVYDDLVDKDSVATAEQIRKTREMWEMSLSLASEGGTMRVIGTRYHANDCYNTMMEREFAEPRIHAATSDGTARGKAVFLSEGSLKRKYKSMGSETFASQMLQDPLADGAKTFNEELVQFYNFRPEMTHGWNLYLICDPASGKKKDNDFTVMVVIGIGPDGNRYLVDGVRDRLNLTERALKLIELHRKWNPKTVGYEEYGMQCDIEYIVTVQDQENYRFAITPLGGNQVSKVDRIRRLQPVVGDKRFYMPYNLYFTDYQYKTQDFTALFINEEMKTHPVSTHDDMLDCVSRIEDPQLGAKAPRKVDRRAGAAAIVRDELDIITGG